MQEIVLALVVVACLSTASLGCLFLHARLPSRHRGDDTQSVVRLVANIFVVLTSLVLGLMVNTAKNRFDAINRDVHVFATDMILLDKLLSFYGPDASDTRKHLIAYAERALYSDWTSSDPTLVSDRLSEQLLDDVGTSLRSLVPSDNRHHAIWNEAREEYRTLFKLRWTLLEQSEGSIPAALVWMLVGWLILIFASFGYGAPRNILVVMSFLLAAALVSGALYLALDMDGPFPGLIKVSRAPLQRALAEMQRQ